MSEEQRKKIKIHHFERLTCGNGFEAVNPIFVDQEGVEYELRGIVGVYGGSLGMDKAPRCTVTALVGLPKW